jgi:hypothetical protein
VHFLGDEEHAVTFDASRAEMEAQLAIFKRLAVREEGEPSVVASDSARSARLGISAIEALRRAYFGTKIADVARARSQLDDATRELENHAREWRDF